MAEWSALPPSTDQNAAQLLQSPLRGCCGRATQGWVNVWCGPFVSIDIRGGEETFAALCTEVRCADEAVLRRKCANVRFGEPFNKRWFLADLFTRAGNPKILHLGLQLHPSLTKNSLLSLWDANAPVARVCASKDGS